MRITFLILLQFANAVPENNATIEFQLANLSIAGFAGKLKIYIGKNCKSNVQKGKICDFSYEGFVTYPTENGMIVNRGFHHTLSTEVNPANDLIFMHYRDPDEAIFKAIRLKVNTGIKNQTHIYELYNAKSGFANAQDKFLIFKYGARNKPCSKQWFPRGAKCIWDATFDLEKKTMDSGISFLHGKEGGNTNESPGNGAKLILKTSRSSSTTGSGVMAYHGFDCEDGICDYIKIGELNVPRQDTTYEFPFGDFDTTKEGFNTINCKSFILLKSQDKDQIILDTRTRGFSISDFKLVPHQNGQPIDLVGKFGSINMNYMNGFYDVVMDFATGRRFVDDSVFI